MRARRHRGLGLRGTGCHQLCAGALHQMTPLRWRSGSIWGCSGSYLFENEAAEFWLLAQELLWRGLKPQRGLTPLTPAQCGCILPSRSFHLFKKEQEPPSRSRGGPTSSPVWHSQDRTAPSGTKPPHAVSTAPIPAAGEELGQFCSVQAPGSFQ